MSYYTERIAIMKYLQNHTNFSLLGTVQFENLPVEDVSGKEYCRADILNFSSMQVTNGGTVNLDRYLGAIQITILAVENTGLNTALQKASVASEMFRNLKLEVVPNKEWITFKTPEVFRGTPRDGRVQVYMRCPFYRDEYL